MKRTLLTLLLAVLGLPLVTACQDVPEATVTAEVPEPGDPAHYAPPGWPLEIGDSISDEEKEALADAFTSFQSPPFPVTLAMALHLVDDVVYTARFDWDHSGIYMGHFPLNEFPWYDDIEEYRRGLPSAFKWNEHLLPPEFHGKIKYGLPNRVPPGSKGISDIGPGPGGFPPGHPLRDER